jgi:hypothetical protein
MQLQHKNLHYKDNNMLDNRVWILALASLFSCATQAMTDGRNIDAAEPSKINATVNWISPDDSCQDMRAKMLMSTSRKGIRFLDQSRCEVSEGEWVSVYSDRRVFRVEDMAVDHVVSLEWALGNGGGNWIHERMTQFFNDPVNLYVVRVDEKRARGGAAPDLWLPDVNTCQYIHRYRRVAAKYGLKDIEAIKQANCEAL